MTNPYVRDKILKAFLHEQEDLILELGDKIGSNRSTPNRDEYMLLELAGFVEIKDSDKAHGWYDVELSTIGLVTYTSIRDDREKEEKQRKGREYFRKRLSDQLNRH